jgi:hypothetical protein
MTLKCRPIQKFVMVHDDTELIYCTFQYVTYIFPRDAPKICHGQVAAGFFTKFSL